MPKKTKIKDNNVENRSNTEARKSTLDKLIEQHLEMVHDRSISIPGLISLAFIFILNRLDLRHFFSGKFRLFTHRDYYINEFNQLTLSTKNLCLDLDKLINFHQNNILKTLNSIKTYMRVHHYSIDRFDEPKKILEIFSRFYPDLSRIPKPLTRFSYHFRLTCQELKSKSFPNFQHLNRFLFFDLKNRNSSSVPSWNQFLEAQIHQALLENVVQLSTSTFSPIEPSTLIGALECNANLLALALETCKIFHSPSKISRDEKKFVDFAAFHGLPSYCWNLLEISIFGLLLIVFEKTISFLYEKLPCNKKYIYYYPDSQKLESRREVEYAIYAVMDACDKDIFKSHRNKTFEKVCFCLFLFLSIFHDFDEMTLVSKIIQVLVFLCAIYGLYETLKNAFSQFSYLKNSEHQRQMLLNLFQSFNQQAKVLINAVDQSSMEIKIDDYSTIPASLVSAAIQSALTRVEIDYIKSNESIMIVDIDRVTARKIQFLNIIIFSCIDSHFIGQLIRRQLDSSIKRIQINRVDLNGAFSHFILSLDKTGLNLLKNRTDHLGLEISEAGVGDNKQVLIKVNHILTQQQLELFGRIESVWISTYANTLSVSHSQQHLSRQLRQRSRGKKEKNQARDQPLSESALLPPLTIDWPCGAQWSSSSHVQSVVPLRAEIPLFLLLCGAIENYPQNIFQLFQTIIQSGPALVAAKKCNGIIKVKPYDEARTEHGRNWKLKHVGTNWRIGAREEHQNGGRAVLLICDRLYQKGNPSTRIDLPMPDFLPHS